jgi:rhomboid protease GluP
MKRMNYALLGITAGSALICAIRLYCIPSGKTRAWLPVLSILIIGITSLVTTLQFFFPEILSELRRNGPAMRAGEWWRMITPLFVQADGWKQCWFNGITALIFLPLAEKFHGKKVLALYFVSGIAGEISKYTWDPDTTGAGSSLAIFGVMGGLLTFVCRHRRELPQMTMVSAMVAFGGAIVLSFLQDSHGFSLLVGFLLMIVLPVDSRVFPAPPLKSPTHTTPLGS